VKDLCTAVPRPDYATARIPKNKKEQSGYRNLFPEEDQYQ